MANATIKGLLINNSLGGNFIKPRMTKATHGGFNISWTPDKALLAQTIARNDEKAVLHGVTFMGNLEHKIKILDITAAKEPGLSKFAS